MRLSIVPKLILLYLLLAVPAAMAKVAKMPDPEEFGVLYTVWIKPETESAVVKIRLPRNAHLVEWAELHLNPERHTKFMGSGEISFQSDKVVWHPPAKDAWLQYRVKLTSKRSNGQYDGLVTPDWALFRADDLVPPISSNIEAPIHAKAKLQFKLPEGWSVETRYPRYHSGRFKVDDAHRLFDQPTGWLVMGKIGTRREKIGHTSVAVSAPVGHDVRYMDVLAFFRWTIPKIQEVFPRFPDRLLIVSGKDPLWRGALSGPTSLYVHSDRPMISGNGTSTFIHELIHVAMRARGGPKADWIVEGIAEYYSLEVLHRSGAISDKRYEKAHKDLAEWGKDVKNLEVDRSSGPVTAKAVGEMRRIDQQIREKSGGTHSLDDVVRGLAQDDGPITRERFAELVASLSRPAKSKETKASQ